MNHRRNFITGIIGGTFGILSGLFTPKESPGKPIVRTAKLIKAEPIKMETVELKGIPRIRLWTMGSLEHKINPTKKAIDKFTQALAKCEVHIKETGEDANLIWGPEVSVQEVKISEEDMDFIIEGQPEGIILIRNPITQKYEISNSYYEDN